MQSQRIHEENPAAGQHTAGVQPADSTATIASRDVEGVSRHKRLKQVIWFAPQTLQEALDSLDAGVARAAVHYVGGPGRDSLWHVAAAARQPHCVRALRQFGTGAIDAADSQGRTPLHVALGWTRAAQEQLLPAVQHAHLRDEFWGRFSPPTDAGGGSPGDCGLRLSRGSRLAAALPAALAFLAARDGECDGSTVAALLQAGANPLLSLHVELDAATSGIAQEQAMERRLMPALISEFGEGGLPPSFLPSDTYRNISPLRMAVMGGARDCIAPLFESLARRNASPMLEDPALLATDQVMVEFSGKLSGHTWMAKTYPRTHKTFWQQMYNCMRGNDDATVPMLMHLARHRDRTILSAIIASLEGIAEQRPKSAQRYVDRTTSQQGCARLLQTLLQLFADPDLVRRTLALGASATEPMLHGDSGMSLRPLAHALGLDEDVQRTLQVLLHPGFRGRLAREVLGLNPQDFEVDRGLVRRGQHMLREIRPNPEIVAALLEGGASARETYDISVCEGPGAFAPMPLGPRPQVEWPLGVSALDLCAMTGTTEVVPLLLRRLDRKKDRDLIATARDRAGLANSRNTQEQLAAFLGEGRE